MLCHAFSYTLYFDSFEYNLIRTFSRRNSWTDGQRTNGYKERLSGRRSDNYTFSILYGIIDMPCGLVAKTNISFKRIHRFLWFSSLSDRWCQVNCPLGHCPAMLCRCGPRAASRKVCKTTKVGPWKNANLDSWCARNCAAGLCPPTRCMCEMVTFTGRWERRGVSLWCDIRRTVSKVAFV
jgi:hypothetical protein